MDIVISLTTSPGVPESALRDKNDLCEVFAPMVESHKFDSKLTTILVFPVIMNPSLGPEQEPTGEYKKRQKEFWSYFPIPFDSYVSASPMGRMELLLDSIACCFKQIPETHLPAEDLDFLITKLDEIRLQFQVHAEKVNRTTKTSCDEATFIHDVSVETQLVLQWHDNRPLPKDAAAHYTESGDDDINSLSKLLEDESHGHYWVDGYDIGSGTVNIFLYAKDEKKALERLIELARRAGLSPP